MFIAGIAAIGGGLLGAYSSKKSNDSAEKQQKAAIEAARRDPRADSMLYGDGTAGSGLLSQYQALGSTPQNDAMKQYGGDMQQFLGTNGAGMTMDMHKTANNLMGGNVLPPGMSAASTTAAQSQAASAMAAQSQSAQSQAAQAQAAQVNAPAQNGMNLTGSYDSFINGERGNNPYLTGAIGKGINQSNNAFGAMQRDSTKNLLENVMPSIRSNSVLSGQYGGSRQGIAEGRALDTFATEQQRAMSQVGQNNTDAAVAAQAGAYDADSNRALGATQGLGAQQYGVASQNSAQQQGANMANASFAQQTNQANAGLTQQNNQSNAGLAQQTALANAGFAQQNNQSNADRQQQAGLANAGFTQGANQASLGAALSTDQLNTGRQTAGIAANSGLLGNAYAAGQNQDGYALNQAGKVGSLLQPYLGQQGVQTQPMAQSSVGGGLLGGAAMGLGMYNQFNQMNRAGGYSSGVGATGGGPAGTQYDGYGYMPVK